MTCRLCEGSRLVELFESDGVTLVLCQDCDLVQNSKLLEGELNLHDTFSQINEEATYRGDYLGGIIEHLDYKVLNPNKSVYFSLTSLSRLLALHGLEASDVTIDGSSFAVSIRPMPLVKQVRMKEQRQKLNNKSTYLLFAMKVKHDRRSDTLGKK